MFHASLLKPHIPNDDDRFPLRDVQSYHDIGYGNEAEQEVDEILAHQGWPDTSPTCEVEFWRFHVGTAQILRQAPRAG